MPLRMARLMSSGDSSSSSRYFTMTSSSSDGDDVEQLGPPLLGLGLELGRDRHLVVVLALVLRLVPDERRHLHEVDDAAVVPLGADRQLDDRRDRLEAILDHRDGPEEVGPDAVHLVDEADPRHAVLVGLAPHRLGLRLDAGHRVEHGDGAVEDAQRTLDFDREIDVAGRVEDVDAMVVPRAGGGRRRDGDAPLLLLDHPVHLSGALVHLTDLVRLARVVQDPLRRRGLARVDVGHDPDVAGSVEGEIALCHVGVTLRSLGVGARR